MLPFSIINKIYGFLRTVPRGSALASGLKHEQLEKLSAWFIAD